MGNRPLYLPEGSIRAVIALMITTVFCLGALYGPIEPDTVTKVILLVIGFYFGQKVKDSA